MVRHVAALVACLPIAIGGYYLAAWLGGAAQHWSASGAITPKTNMVLCQVLAGLSLLFVIRGRSRSARAIAAALAAVVVATGAATLVEHLAGVDLGIDQILASEPPGGTATMSPNRMGPPGAVSLTLLGLGLLALTGRRHRTALVFAMGTGLVIAVPIVGFLYGIRDFYGIARFTGISWQTVIALFAIAAGILLATPDTGAVALIRSSADPGGRLLRRWLLPVLLVPLVAGWLRTYVADRGLLDSANGTGLLILALLVFMFFMLWQSAAQVSKWSLRQRQATAALHESRHEWQQLAEAMPQLVWTCTAGGECDYLSPQWLRFTGTPAEAQYGYGWLSQVHPEDRGALETVWREALTSGDVFAAEFRLRRHDGVWRWFIARAQPIRAADGQILKWYGSSTDVHDLKETQAALRTSANRFELLSTTAATLLKSRDPQGAVTALCRRVLDHLDCEVYFNFLLDRQEGRLHLNACAGVEPEAAARLEWLDLGAAVCGQVAREGAGMVVAQVQADPDPRLAPIRALGVRAYACLPLTASDEATFGTLSFGSRRRDAFTADEVALMRAVADQVATAMMRIRGEQMILRSERLFRQMADAAPAMLWITETGGSVTYRSRAWHEYTGIGETPPGAAGRDGAEAVHPQDRRRLRSALAAAGERREPFTLEYRLRRADGAFRWVMDAGRPRWSDDGGFQGFVGSVIDIDDRRRVEDEVRNLNTTLEHRVEQRTSELRRMTLELTRVEQRERDHLAELLHDGLQQLLVAAKLHVGLVVRAADLARREERAGQLTDLLQEALRSTRTLTVELSPPALRERGLLPALHWLAEWMHETHHLEVEIAAPASLEPLDATTRALLFQCVRELLLNVVKYAGVKEARIALSTRGSDALQLEVSDHGLGFDPTAVAEAAPTFGLASIRRRIDLVGGAVAIVAAPGAGAQVTLTVPLPETEASDAMSPAAAPVASESPPAARAVPRVLLVDDHAMVRQGLAGILRDRRDLELVGEAADGLQAIELAAALKPDVVIMDIRLPGIDGIEATRRLLARSPSSQVIGLSTYESAEKEAQMREAGAVAYLTKDGPADTLIDTIRRVCAARSSTA